MPRSWFADDIITAHLDRLESEQLDDGGWPITWEPLSAATGSEWRGIRTIHALSVLAAYERVDVDW